MNTSRCPLSSMTGMYTVISLFGYFRNRYRPSSRFSFRAAASNRASADSYTLNSFLETSVAMANPPRTPGPCCLHPARRTHAFEPALTPQNSAIGLEGQYTNQHYAAQGKEWGIRRVICPLAARQPVHPHHEGWKQQTALDSCVLDLKLAATLSGKLPPFPVRSDL